ncbi:MAG TPA: SRPBCC domain-containing protein [Acidimicrobiales bacterium]|nr:SRPBCC domain-containing protein [Acidimicrobiales bacterium]
MKTTFPVSAPPEAWAALADPQRLAAALPNCRSVTRDADDGTLHVVTEVAVASVRGLWAGTVAPVDAGAVHVRGSGAPGVVDLVVRADPERTSLTVEGTVDGALGTVGAAVLAGAVRRMAEDLLAATEPPTPAASRGHESGPDQPEATGAGSGAHDLEPEAAETVASGTKGARRAARRAGGAALVGVVIAVVVRRRARGRAG